MIDDGAVGVILAMSRYVERLEDRIRKLEDPQFAIHRLLDLGHITPMPGEGDPLGVRSFRSVEGLGDGGFGAAFDEAMRE